LDGGTLSSIAIFEEYVGQISKWLQIDGSSEISGIISNFLRQLEVKCPQSTSRTWNNRS
jgi:hypothetical protein